jgi:hypothetical protein
MEGAGACAALKYTLLRGASSVSLLWDVQQIAQQGS